MVSLMMVSVWLAGLTTRLAADASLVRDAHTLSLFALQLYKKPSRGIKTSVSSWLVCVHFMKTNCEKVDLCTKILGPSTEVWSYS